jgi:hypothetical protein
VKERKKESYFEIKIAIVATIIVGANSDHLFSSMILHKILKSAN